MEIYCRRRPPATQTWPWLQPKQLFWCGILVKVVKNITNYYGPHNVIYPYHNVYISENTIFKKLSWLTVFNHNLLIKYDYFRIYLYSWPALLVGEEAGGNLLLRIDIGAYNRWNVDHRHLFFTHQSPSAMFAILFRSSKKYLCLYYDYVSISRCTAMPCLKPFKLANVDFEWEEKGHWGYSLRMHISYCSLVHAQESNLWNKTVTNHIYLRSGQGMGIHLLSRKVWRKARMAESSEKRDVSLMQQTSPFEQIANR